MIVKVLQQFVKINGCGFLMLLMLVMHGIRIYVSHGCVCVLNNGSDGVLMKLISARSYRNALNQYKGHKVKYACNEVSL